MLYLDLENFTSMIEEINLRIFPYSSQEKDTLNSDFDIPVCATNK